MKIGLDIMGGDYAPEAAVKGAILAHKELDSSVRLVLIGDEKRAKEILDAEQYSSANFDFVHTTEVIGMDDHPAKAFQKKADSSITRGFYLLKEGAIEGFASAGNTGAMMVGAMFTIKSIPGIIRPCIAALVPKPDDKFSILLDVGLNPDCRPDVLYQYAIIGSIFAKNVFNIENPKIGLLNIGEEKEKGSLLTKATNESMQGSTDFNFIGNVEGTDLFSPKVDVIVCDGFVGNVLLKTAEAFYELFRHHRNIEDDLLDRFNFVNYGGTPVLGVNNNVIVGHGVSNPEAIKNMVLHTRDVIEAKLPERFQNRFK